MIDLDAPDNPGDIQWYWDEVLDYYTGWADDLLYIATPAGGAWLCRVNDNRGHPIALFVTADPVRVQAGAALRHQSYLERAALLAERITAA